MNHLKRAIKICGGQTALAKACGVKQAHVWNWLNRGKTIPAERAIQIEMATKGKVRCEDLRPDVPWHILRKRTEPSTEAA